MNENNLISRPRGTRDILPADQPYWRHFYRVAESVLEGLGIEKIDLPIFEDSKLFERGVGSGTDIIEKELFLVSGAKSTDDEPRYALRPEGTAGAARAYIENGMESLPRPVRLYYTGTMYRYERPQKGRYREHRQLGVEIFGDRTAKSDYMIIMAATRILKKLGFSDLIVSINSIGCPECRPAYIKKLKAYYKPKLGDLCEDCRNRYEANPLRLLDCKNENCQKFKKSAPQIIDKLCTECETHFQQTLEYLDDFGIKFNLDPTLVRGLDYYTKTVFEIASTSDKERLKTLCGGGRYDQLVALLGGKQTSAVGFGMGIDRVVNEMKAMNVKVPKTRGVEVVILELGKGAKKLCKKIYTNLNDYDINVFYIPANTSLRVQLKMAAKMNADYVLIVGQKEAASGSVIVRDLKAGTQEDLPFDRAIKLLKDNYDQIESQKA